MNRDRIDLRIENSIATLTLNRAEKRNALDLAMFRALDSAAQQLRRDRTVRALIIRGNGEDFCSGLDIKAVLGNPLAGLKLLWKWLPGNANLAQRACVNWRRLPMPVIAAIHGRCWGGGLQIALGADVRVATADASLSIMEAKWGIIPDMGGTLALRELLAIDTALRLASTAELISGEQALQMGLVSSLDRNPYQAALALAQRFVERSPDSVAAAKKLYHHAWSQNQRAILARETIYQWRLLLGKNQKVAVAKAKGESEKSYGARGVWW